MGAKGHSGPSSMMMGEPNDKRISNLHQEKPSRDFWLKKIPNIFDQFSKEFIRFKPFDTFLLQSKLNFYILLHIFQFLFF